MNDGTENGMRENQDGQPMPPRRRRPLPDARPPAGESPAPPAIPPRADAAEIDTGPAREEALRDTEGRRAVDDGERKRSGVEPSASASAPRVESGAGKPEKGKAKAVDDEAPAGPSTARRVVRITLILLVMAAMIGFIFILLDEQQQEEFFSDDDIPKFAFLQPDPEGDDIAGDLMLRIRNGDSAAVLAMRDKVMERRPINAECLRAVLLAEAVEAVGHIKAELAKLPSTEASKGEFLPIEEKLKRIGPRVSLLNRLADYRTDWGEALTSLPVVDRIYADTAVEISATSTRIANWEQALAQLRRVLDDISLSSPDYDAIRAALSLANDKVPENDIGRVMRNVDSLKNAQLMLAVMDMRKANEFLGQMELRPAPPESRHTEDMIEGVLARRTNSLKNQFASWRTLWEEGERAAALYARGETGTAADALSKAIDAATIDSAPIKALQDQLRARLAHYRTVLDAWQSALAAEKAGDFAGRIKGWQAFALTITQADDPAQYAAAGEHIAKLRDDIGGEINSRAERLSGIWDAYAPPDAAMRAPSSPREAFAAKAKQIAEAAVIADEIIHLSSLAPQWTGAGKTRESVNLSRRVLAEQSDQAQRLWNVGRIYRDRGEIAWFRECMERLLLLGDNRSNPFYAEAVKVLSEPEGGGPTEPDNGD